MVSTGARNSADSLPTVKPLELPEEELRWCSVPLNELVEGGLRLDASVFDIEGKYAREVLKSSKWPILNITGEDGLATSFYPGRFRRILVEESEYPLILPSQIQEIKPIPKGYLSPLCDTDFELLKAKRGQVLLTRSGTIGNCTFVGKTLDGKTLSDDIIRITCKEKEDAGYVYAFLRTKIGKALIQTNKYGAVVSHIEPEHLESVPIPNPSTILKTQIHNLIRRSYDLRDESNDLLNEAEQLLSAALKLRPLSELHLRHTNGTTDLSGSAVKLSNLGGRLDASYHAPIVNAILAHLNLEAAEVTLIGDPRISKSVMLPGRFSRVFVQEGQGAVYFTGKHILELDPSDKKYLAYARHGALIRDQLTIRKNMILVTSSGTLGKVVLVPRHWDGWAMTHDIIRIIPSSEDYPGYLWVLLASPYGQELVRRYTYGSVVEHIELEHIIQTPVPLLKDVAIQNEINRLALEANEKRSEAYDVEKQAIHITNEEVIHAS